jgi:hypothetical protein
MVGAYFALMAFIAVSGYYRGLYGKIKWITNIIHVVSNMGRIAFIDNGNFVETDGAHIIYWWGKYYTMRRPIVQLTARPVPEYSDPLTIFTKEYKDDKAYHIIYAGITIFILDHSSQRFMFGINSQNKVIFMDADTLEILPYREYYRYSNEFHDYTVEDNIFVIGGRKYKLGRGLDSVEFIANYYFKVFLCDDIYFVAFRVNFIDWISAQLYLDGSRTKPALH